MAKLSGSVEAVSRSPRHAFSKSNALSIRLVAGFGVEGDAHAGATVKHRSRVARDPAQANLRQVHLMQGELHDELNAGGFTVRAGDLGENITTRGLDILALPTGARLSFGGTAVVEITGLRNPCFQLDKFQPGLTQAVLARGPNGELVRRAGVMGIVLAGGDVHPGDAIGVELPAGAHRPLQVV
ncbi:MAG TPA: MOSC domain-containing protein [Phenylobacterium sp.]